MKVSPLSASAAGSPGTDIGNINLGATASPEKLAAAKAIAQGEEPVKTEEERRDDLVRNVRKIKMRTNYSTNRDDVVAAPVEAAPVEASTKPDDSGQTQVAVESTQPLSPQFAALAKQRRALQVKERELAEREAKVAKPPEGEYVATADLLANPLKIFDLGLTYDQLTEAIIADQNGVTPEIKALKDELKALKEGVDNKFVTQAEAQEEAALHSIADEIESLSKEGEDYELIRSRKAIGLVLSKIYSHYKKTGEVRDTKAVMDEVENQILDQAVKYSNIGKVKSKIAPPQVQPPQLQGKQMKTLTNRDGAMIPMDKRTRAIMAMNGTLRK